MVCYSFACGTCTRQFSGLPRAHLGAAVLSTWILYLGRGEIFDGFRKSPSSVILGGLRYSFIPGFFVLSALWITYQEVADARLRWIYGALLLPLLLYAGLRNYPFLETVANVNWPETARQLEDFRAGQRDFVDRPIIPEGWRIQVRRKPSEGRANDQSAPP
jgi:hypothetical protein